ncbi:MAG TPA: universal stress protein [Actinomycetota bacterium]|nr:universal stress protein [Actinomycetota bacterium]
MLAYDASPGAEEAVSLLTTMPWPPGSAVRVVTVVEPSAAMVPAAPFVPARLVPSPEMEAQVLEHLKAELARAVGLLRASGLDSDGEVLRGRPATVLVDEANRFAADLIVAGSRGHGPIASLVLGSVSAELVDHAPCPVLVARRPAAQRVLFASDGSLSASDAEEVLARWPIFDGTTMRVVSVTEVVRPWHTGLAPTTYRQAVEAYGEDLEAAKREHWVVARGAASRLELGGGSVDATVRVGDAAAEILEEASTWRADLIVLGSRGLTGLSRLLLGSVARNVLQGTESSVLIVHDAAETRSGGVQLK